MRKKIKMQLLFLAFILITISNSSYLSNISLNSYFEYISFGILIIINFPIFIKNWKINLKKIILFSVILFLFSIGIMLQNLGINVKIRLIISMLLMEIFMIFSNNILNDYKYIRVASYRFIYRNNFYYNYSIDF